MTEANDETREVKNITTVVRIMCEEYVSLKILSQ